mmetsp:Transcript_5164/g.7946  ORF Transcript_5164/g.7946 Transcript_5164/m.7946 type:complete len:147 (+) Transcript_5164:959-1399(+)|eukprot:CAMPEP_0170498960 /NCGR_PEP_ID=MMETSP0208-20121228/29599_1 /TAXON_ID=197538 /ORGANISM="Strombidium inclinatum, Strain S3" /LENGTH=146 /DNA_ID=CAMNT_0010776319 /DNA_START=894 /DNA_END=1334 /DNA_ORIENTATION=+
MKSKSPHHSGLKGFIFEEEQLNEIDDISPHKQFVALERQNERLQEENLELQRLYNDSCFKNQEQQNQLDLFKADIRGAKDLHNSLEDRVGELEKYNDQLRNQLDSQKVRAQKLEASLSMTQQQFNNEKQILEQRILELNQDLMTSH